MCGSVPLGVGYDTGPHQEAVFTPQREGRPSPGLRRGAAAYAVVSWTFVAQAPVARGPEERCLNSYHAMTERSMVLDQAQREISNR